MVIFGVQKDQFLHWCISKSQTRTVQSLTINNSTTSTISGYNISDISGFVFMPINEGSDLYNCTRLWEDEMKFSVVIFFILFTLYVSIQLPSFFFMILTITRFISLFVSGVIHKIAWFGSSKCLRVCTDHKAIII